MSTKEVADHGTKANVIVAVQASILLCFAIGSIMSWNVVIITISDLHLALGSRSNTTQVKEDTTYFQSAGLKVFYDPVQQGILYAAPLVSGLIFAYPIQRCLCQYHARFVYSIITAVSIVSTAVHPLMLPENFYLVVLVRLVQGVVFALVFPTIAYFITYWSTLAENTVFMSIFMGVAQLSGLLSIPLSSYFVKHYGWPLAFYAHAGITGLFWLIWTFNYRENTVFSRANLARTKLSFSTMAYHLRQTNTWAVLFATAANCTLVVFVVQFLQLFLMSAHGVRMQNAGVIVGGLIASQFFVKVISGFLVQKMTFMPLSWRIRFFNSIAFFAPAALLVWDATGLKSDQAKLLSILLVFVVGGFNAGGFLKSPAFIQQGAWIVGAVHAVNALVSITFSMVVPILAPNGSFHEFHFCFVIVATALTVGNILFCLLSRAGEPNHTASMLTISTIAPFGDF
ncbi:unnamed protein product [Bursaphelenchus okinawaensis]|uniref:MFS domain-containing protein n=1 Tax=Bursaphelenchus okinawaensis TaxID=465554 RepID=A0A811LK91_9BILA|nr:unnamed protein product [Bursaphelenchus okinawaensis]CAG9127424.1 unnamed protein product [Bursaphelenchus okinawaensis]